MHRKCSRRHCCDSSRKTRRRRTANRALDYDLVCGCQDFDISHVAIAIAIEQTAPQTARAVVQFDNAGQHKTITLDLAGSRRRWRIEDIHDDQVPTLVAFLRQTLQAAPKAH